MRMDENFKFLRNQLMRARTCFLSFLSLIWGWKRIGHGQVPQNVSLFFKMSVNKLWQLILVNLSVLIRNLNVTKLENPQFLRNLRFFAFPGKIVRPWKSMIFGGLQNQKWPIPGDRALQTEQKNVLHQSLNFSRSKIMGVFMVKIVLNFAWIMQIMREIPHFLSLFGH